MTMVMKYGAFQPASLGKIDFDRKGKAALTSCNNQFVAKADAAKTLGKKKEAKVWRKAARIVRAHLAELED